MKLPSKLISKWLVSQAREPTMVFLFSMNSQIRMTQLSCCLFEESGVMKN